MPPDDKRCEAIGFPIVWLAGHWPAKPYEPQGRPFSEFVAQTTKVALLPRFRVGFLVPNVAEG